MLPPSKYSMYVHVHLVMVFLAKFNTVCALHILTWPAVGNLTTLLE